MVLRKKLKFFSGVAVRVAVCMFSGNLLALTALPMVVTMAMTMKVIVMPRRTLATVTSMSVATVMAMATTMREIMKED